MFSALLMSAKKRAPVKAPAATAAAAQAGSADDGSGDDAQLVALGHDALGDER